MAHLSNTSIEIDGKSIKQFTSLQLSQGISEHHSFRLVCPSEALDETTGSLFNSSRNLIGSSISIRINQVGKTGGLKFTGVVTQLDAERYSGHAGDIVISGFSPTIIMDNLPDFKSWESKSLSDIANNVLQNFPKNLLQPSVNPSYSKKFDYKVQYKETAWQFLTRQSSLYGEWFFYDGEKLKLGPLKSDTTSLVYGSDLSEFTMSLQINPSKFKITAYDYTTPDTYDWNTANVETRAGLNDLGKHTMQKSRDFFGTQPKQWINNCLLDKNTLDDMLTTNAAMEGSKLVYFNGSSGQPSVKVGDVISVSGKNVFSLADESFGDYIIISVNHFTDGQGNYQNHFVSIPSSIQVPPGKEFPQPVCETQHAIVTDNEDKNGMDRIRVKFPWQENEKTPWISVVTPYAGKGKGVRFIPEINEEVLVSFIDNDPEQPYVIGAIHTDKSKSGFSTDKNAVKSITTKSGRRIEITEGTSIELSDYSGNNPGNALVLEKSDSKTYAKMSSGSDNDNFALIVMQQEKFVEIAIKKGGTNTLTILFDSDKNDISIKSKGTINISADGDLNISGQNVNIAAQTNLALKASGSGSGAISLDAESKIDINSDQDLNVSGLDATVSASASLTVKSDGATAIKGAIVQIN